MSEHHTQCDRFQALLADGATATEVRPWLDHLEACANCREQWVTHQMLRATFGSVPVPELSMSFETDLQRKIEGSIEVTPLAGWRIVAMGAYALAAVATLTWVFKRFPLPSIPLDPSSPWMVLLVLGAVPLTIWAVIGISRWLPAGRKTDFTQLNLL